MRSARWYWALGLLGLAVVGSVHAAGRVEEFVAGQRLRMWTEVPIGYSFVAEPSGNGVTTVELENPVWRIALRVYISGDVPPEATTAEWQRVLVVKHSSNLLPQSRESDYVWADLLPDSGSGVFCIFTDAQAKTANQLRDGGYLHVVAGAKVIRGAVMYFTIYCNDVTTPEYDEIFALLLKSFDRV